MSQGNLLYAQSGGVTAVINATACAVIEACRKHRIRAYAARNGIIGALREELFDLAYEDRAAIAALRHTPGGAFGSCRFKLKSLEVDRARYERLIDVLRAHDIRYFLYNGGNDSADTSLKISVIGKELGYPLQVIGVPKIDNDLPSPTRPAHREVGGDPRRADVASMSESSTKVFVMEVMGATPAGSPRRPGWPARAPTFRRTSFCFRKSHSTKRHSWPRSR